jgi:hypothetical protein
MDKMYKKILSVAILLLTLTLLFTSCGGGERLSGTWVNTSEENSFESTLEFSGRKFTETVTDLETGAVLLARAGTYSIDRDIITFSYDDGRVQDFVFIRFADEENIISIGFTDFTRQ